MVSSIREMPHPDLALRALELSPLSDHADEQLRRACGFFIGLQVSGLALQVLLAGYTVETHQIGAFLTSWVSGDRSFAEWRLVRSSRPLRDPDLPELLAVLEAVVAEWHPRALGAVSEWPDPEDREEVAGYLEMRELPSRTWRARSWLQKIRALGTISTPFHRATWEALVRMGIEAPLERLETALGVVQEVILTAPLDEHEIADVAKEREWAAEQLGDWLSLRRDELAPALSEESLTLLALGEAVPPSLPDVPLQEIVAFPSFARA